ATAKDKVSLMTVHAAKGLEFPHVFLCGMNEGIFPSRKVKTLAGMEEERRLAFVALTRAQDSLHLSGADGYNLDGVPRYPSRFVLDIDKRHIEFTPEPPEESISQARAFIKAHARTLTPSGSAPRFTKGSVVVHRTFGRGTVVDIDAERGAYIIQFDKLETTRSIAFKIRLEAGE
ncbi:MAG: 3'-5' exonuclease, partial [Eggerthellaceae bacterium]